ncbi:MAG: hypothetical protein LKJ65_02600, partial [Lactobacillus sp.]|nr:hypothetical protein [Lactobacillus sp.]
MLIAQVDFSNLQTRIRKKHANLGRMTPKGCFCGSECRVFGLNEWSKAILKHWVFHMKPDCFRSHQTIFPLCQKEPGQLLASLTVFFANLFRQNVAFFLLIPLCNKNFLGGEKNVIFYQTSSLVARCR